MPVLLISYKIRNTTNPPQQAVKIQPLIDLILQCVFKTRCKEIRRELQGLVYEEPPIK